MTTPLKSSNMQDLEKGALPRKKRPRISIYQTTARPGEAEYRQADTRERRQP